MTLNYDLARRTRRWKDLTQGDLAEQVGVHKDALAGWERGEHEPSLTNTIKWAQCLGLKLSDLLGETPEPAPAKAVGE